jgi:hypothetical protein
MRGLSVASNVNIHAVQNLMLLIPDENTSRPTKGAH